MTILSLELCAPLVALALVKGAGMPREAAGWAFIFLSLVLLALLWRESTRGVLRWLNVAFLFTGVTSFSSHFGHWGADLGSYVVFGVKAVYLHHLIEMLFEALVVRTAWELVQALRDTDDTEVTAIDSMNR